MTLYGDNQVWFHGQNWSGQGQYLTSITTSGTSGYPLSYYQPQPVISSVLESPSRKLGDREWLDAQVAEVCELAEAA